MTYTLRDYQNDAVAAGRRALSMQKNAVLVLPTGSGKSLCIASLLEGLPGHSLVLQPSKEILEQNKSKAEAFGFHDIGVWSASCGRKDLGKVTFAMIGSILRHREAFKHFERVIVDECNLVNSQRGMYESFLSGLGVPVVGCTATPYRMRAWMDPATGDPVAQSQILTRTRPRVFASIAHVTQVGELVRDGFWSPLTIGRQDEDYRPDEIAANSTGQDYDEAALRAYHEAKQIVRRAADSVRACRAKHVLLFTRFREESAQVLELLDGANVSCAEVSAETPARERAEILAGFRNGSIRCVVNVGVLTCLSDDTEVLTRRGWIGIDGILPEDHVAQYDQGIITFARPSRIISKQIRPGSEMIEVDGRYVSMSVTPDHDMLATTSRLGPFRKTKAIELLGRKVYIPVSGLAAPDPIQVQQEVPRMSRSRFIATNSYNYRKKGMSRADSKALAEATWAKKVKLRYKNPDELTLDECRLIGFWLGDGSCCRVPGNGVRYSLCQSLRTPQMIAWIERILESCGVDYNSCDHTPLSDTRCFIVSRVCHVSSHRSYGLAIGTGGHKQRKRGIYHLLPYLKKSGTDAFWGLDAEQFSALMEGLWMADGWHGDCRSFDGSKIVGASKGLFDLLQAIGVCRGYRVTVKPIKMRPSNKKQLYQISMRKKPRHQLVRDRLRIRYVAGLGHRVWCVTMPEGTIVTRRKGTVVIMGNCGFDFPALDCVVLARPTKSVALYYQMTGRGVRPCEGKEQCLLIDLCGNVRRFGRVQTFSLTDPSGRGLWELRSEAGLLTGVTVSSSRPRAAFAGALPVETLGAMPFGKFRGTPISKLPVWYVRWAAEHLPGKWRAVLAAEQDRRRATQQ